MNDPLIIKVEQLFKEGKITEEEKEKLIASLTEGSKKSFSSVVLNLRTVDVEVVGKENSDKVLVEGAPLKQTYKDDKIVLDDSLLKSSGKSIVYIPYNTNLFVKGVTSDIMIENLVTHIEIQTVSSKIVLKNVSYSCVVSGISSDIILESFSGTLSLNTKTGKVKVFKSNISAFLKTYSGDIDIGSSVLRDTRINTFNGGILFEKCKFEGKNVISTHFGDILLREIDRNDLNIKVNTTFGDVIGLKSEDSKKRNILEVETKFGDIKMEGNNETQRF